jgi:hypothetical protein
VASTGYNCHLGKNTGTRGADGVSGIRVQSEATGAEYAAAKITGSCIKSDGTTTHICQQCLRWLTNGEQKGQGALCDSCAD